MKFSAGLALLSLIPYSVSSPVSTGNSSTCTNPGIRREWRTLADDEKANYISAVQCILDKPGTYTDVYNGTIPRLTVFEDFTYIHKSETAYIHFVGKFFAWHRLLLFKYEEALKACGFTGSHPYWHQSQDVDSFDDILASPVFDPDTGFGGNGVNISYIPPGPFPIPEGTGGGCVPDGPFANRTIVRIAKNNTELREDRCLDRGLNPTVAKYWCNATEEARILSQPDYISFWRSIEGGTNYTTWGLHGGGHGWLGGTDNDLYVSSSDPLFYLHHANVDRIWREWQRIDLEDRLFQINGNHTPWTMMLEPDLDRIPEGNITLDYELQLGELSELVKVEDLMDTAGDYLCYDYE